jgi:metallophosphoesterase (TIGR03767 family)
MHRGFGSSSNVPHGSTRTVRHTVLMKWRLAAVCAVGAAVVGVVAAASTSSSRPHAPWNGSTLVATFVDRAGELARGPGEPLRARTELAPRAPAGRTLATFAQITDAHVTDEESPARLEPLDRLGPPFTSAFRPQEALTGQVLAAAVRSLNALRPQAVVVTGDLIDNAQANELDEATSILDGGVIDPSSGARAYEGVQSADDPDPFYYRPDVDPPRHRNLLRDAERRFRSPGLRAPWYPVVGNHDLLVQGNLAPTAQTRAVAVGSRKLVQPSAAALAAAGARALNATTIRRLLAHGLPGTVETVTPDGRRREPAATEVLRRLRRASGHGGSGALLDYAFDIGPRVRGIVLDLVSRRGGAGGVVHPGQAAWLARSLRAAGSRWVVVFSHQPLERVAGGARLLALLDRDARVVAAVAGDIHRNSIAPRRTAAGGYWLVTTASLVDWPQQARMFRLRETERGVVLETWTVDPDPQDRLASISRELAYLDYQGGRPQGFAGAPGDRNAALYR